MKNIFVITLALFLAGCSVLPKPTNTVGKISKQEQKQVQTIQSIDDKINYSNVKKLDLIGQYSYGLDYVLRKTDSVTNISTVCYDLNNRILSLASQPLIDSQKEMKELCDILLTNYNKGFVLLNKKDKEIEALQTENKILLTSKDKELKQYMKAAGSAATVADGYKSQLDSMNGWLGLGAVWYGLKHFFFSSLWIILGVIFVFFLLRILSTVNPIAASIFAIFEHVVSWIISTIQIIAPKALNIAGNVSTAVYNATSNILKKIIDNIQAIKEKEKVLGRKMTVEELLDELEKSLDSKEKEQIAIIKKELGY